MFVELGSIENLHFYNYKIEKNKIKPRFLRDAKFIQLKRVSPEILLIIMFLLETTRDY